MTGRIAARLAELRITLPAPARPAGAYVPYVAAGRLVFVSGQLCLWEGKLRHRGPVGGDVSVDDGREAARVCALNLLAQVRDACGGDLDRVARVVRLGGFVQCGSDFVDHPTVLDGASNLMMDIFGEAGRHTRFAVGASSLPRDASVEVDGIFEID